MLRAVTRVNGHQRGTVLSRPDTRCRAERRGEMRQHRLLRGEHLWILERVGDLEDDPLSVAAFDQKILIALARQGRRSAIDAEMFTGEMLRGRKIEPRRLLDHDRPDVSQSGRR